MTGRQIVELINREDRKVALAVRKEIPAIAQAVDAIVAGIRKGGPLIYVGAGSSGRMAVLDAAFRGGGGARTARKKIDAE